MADSATYRLTRPVFIIGFMGAGKTTLARRISRMCKLASIDVDYCLEQATSMRAKQLYLTVGEERFRRMEADQIESYVNGAPRIIACGGGIVMGERSRQIIREKGFVVYLRVSPDESAKRISDHSTRPFFETMENVHAIHEQRVPYYEELADVTLSTAGKTVGKLTYQLRGVLLKRGVLCRA